MESGTPPPGDSDNGGLTPDHNSSAPAAPSVEDVDMVSLVSGSGWGGRDGVHGKKVGRESRKRMIEKIIR